MNKTDELYGFLNTQSSNDDDDDDDNHAIVLLSPAYDLRLGELELLFSMKNFFFCVYH